MRIKEYSFICLGLICISTSATPIKNGNNFQTKRELSSTPRRWSRIATPPSDHILNLRIGLTQSHADELIETLEKISDPDHNAYGSHLSPDDLRSFVQPNEDSVTFVKDWLAEHGFSDNDISFSTHRDWMQINAPVKVVESMLSTEYQVYQHDNGIDKIIRTLSYSLPEHLHDHIDIVHPTTYFHTSRRQIPEANDEKQNIQRRSPMIVNSDNEMLPIDIFRIFYKTIDYVPKAADKNKIAVLGYEEENAIYTDLALFLADERPDAIGANFSYVLVNGGINNQSHPGVGEADLDVQTVIGVAYPTPVDFISIGEAAGDNLDDVILTEYFLSLPDDQLPRTITVSYGSDEQEIPFDIARRICHNYAQLGSRGVSVFVASGDSGVEGDEGCLSSDGTNKTEFLPDFPASCPYVTAVGATRDFYPEVAEYSDFYSGAGFSNYFKRPSYQDKAVSEYLQKIGDLNQGLYNASGRGYPDVAAQGHNYKIYTDAAPGPASGTSASTPMFAAIVTLLNDHLISQNKRPLGFLNPFLYKRGYQGLNDIVQGSSSGCNTTGFPAMPGWDAVTGLGTPDFQKLLKLVDSV